MKYLFLVSLLILFSGSFSAQGALDGYMKGKGHLDIAPSFSFMRARDFAGTGGEKYDIPYNGNLLSVFAAYGITDRLDVVVSIPYIFTSTQRGLQDGGFYAKYRLVNARLGEKSKLSLIAGTGVSLPLSSYEPVAAGALGQRAIVIPGRLIVQWDTPWGPFVNLTGGYNWRLDDYKEADLARVKAARPDYDPPTPPDYTSLLVKAGLPAAHFYVDGWVEYQYTPSARGADFVPGAADLAQAYGVTYTQVGGTIYYSENGKRGVFISGGKILAGRNVSRILRFTGGIVVKL